MGRKLITLTEEIQRTGTEKNLIPVHINTARCEKYFWDWSSDHGDWVRGREISSILKRHLKNPPTKSNYK